MRRILLALWFGLWPLLWGVCLPYFQFPDSLRLYNYFWGGVCGLGLWVTDITVGLSLDSRLLLGLGVLVWPIGVSMVMFLIGWMLDKITFKMRLVVISALLVSCLLTENLQTLMQPPMSNIPTYYRLFAAVW
jgi:hypothetical protein